MPENVTRSPKICNPSTQRTTVPMLVCFPSVTSCDLSGWHQAHTLVYCSVNLLLHQQHSHYKSPVKNIITASFLYIRKLCYYLLFHSLEVIPLCSSRCYALQAMLCLTSLHIHFYSILNYVLRINFHTSHYWGRACEHFTYKCLFPIGSTQTESYLSYLFLVYS